MNESATKVTPMRWLHNGVIEMRAILQKQKQEQEKKQRDAEWFKREAKRKASRLLAALPDQAKMRLILCLLIRQRVSNFA